MDLEKDSLVGRGWCMDGCETLEITWESHVSADKVYRTVNLNVEFLWAVHIDRYA